MPALTRDDVNLWGKPQLLRELPSANAFRYASLEQLRDLAWLEIQKRQIDGMDNTREVGA